MGRVGKPAYRAGFMAIGAMIIILAGINFSSPLSVNSGLTIASNLAIIFGALMLFVALVNYTQTGREVLAGVTCIVLSIILIAVYFLSGEPSRPLLIGSMLAFMGGIFSLIASRR